MTCTLYLSPTNDATVAHLRAHVAALKAADPLAPVHLLLPSARVIERLRRELDNAFNLHFHQFYGLARTVLNDGRQARVHEIKDTAARRLIHTLLAQMAAAGELSTFAPVWQKPGFTDVILDWLREVKSQGIRPDAVEAEAVRTGQERDRQLALLYARYQAFLIDHDLSDADGLLWLAAEATAADPACFRQAAPLLVYGFDQFNPVQLDLLAGLTACFAHTHIYLLWDDARPPDAPALVRLANTKAALEMRLEPETVTLPAPLQPTTMDHLRRTLLQPGADAAPDHAGLALVAAPAREEEVRHALRRVKQLLLEGVPAHEIALCAPKPGVYRRLVETVAHEYGVPVAVERILGVNPAVAALLNALSLSPDFPWRATFDLLRSPYVDLALWLDAAQVDLLDRLTRERPVVGGLDQWRHALTPLRLADHGDVEDEDLHGVPLVASLPPAELDALRGGLLALFAHLTPPEHAAPAEYVLWIQSALLGLPPELDEDDAGAPDAPPPSLHMLERCDAPGGEDAARDHAAMALLLRSLRQLVDAVALIDGAAAAATERATAPVAWPRFRTDLMNILPAVPVYPPDDVAQARFDTLAGIRGLTPAHLLVLGLSEGEFPTPPAADVLYCPQERAAEDGLPLREHVSGDDGTLWWQALANVGTSLTLLRPWLDEKGAHWPPSPYWQAVVDLFSGPVVHEIKVSARPQPAQAARDSELLVALAEDGAALTPPGLAISWQLAQRGAGLIRLRSGFTAPGPYEGIITDAALRAQLAQHYGPDHVWSASRLNRYNSCPFGFFVENVLKLMPRPDPEEGADARQRGSLMHAILEALYMRLAAANLAPMSDNATQVLAWLDEACAAAFVDAPQRYGFRPGPLWQQEQAEMQRQLTALVRWECDENGATPRFRPFRQELGFGVRGSVPPVTLADGDGRVLRLRGLIDRVDRADDGGLRIVDYKSGSTEYFGTDIREGRSVQTALYALAAEQLLDGAPVVQSVYLHIPKRKTSGEIDRRKPDQAQELLTAALAAATTAADQIRAGRFPNAPSKRSGNACSGWCDMKDMCRVTRVSVWKARLSAP